jgi:hypothetical protein
MKERLLVRFVRTMVLVAVVVVSIFETGCRRTDVRDFEVSIPKLASDKEVIVRQALARFGGVDKGSIKFDQKSKKLILKYDSMQLAKKNIEIAIAKAGLEANGVTPSSVGAEAK